MADQTAKGQDSAQRNPTLSTRSVVLFYLVVAVVAVLWSDRSRALAFQWKWVSLGIVATVLIALFVPYTRDALDRASTQARAAFLFFLVIPILIVAVGSFFALTPQNQFFALRSLFLFIVILLPGVMFYLFIVSTKISLLNEFVANLDRLGLLPSEVAKTENGARELGSMGLVSRERGLESYLRKFEAIYGRVSSDMLRHALSGESDSTNPDFTSRTGMQSALTAETGVPVVIATLLIALGWLLTLPLSTGGEALKASNPWIAALTPEKAPAYFAFLGAYFFSLQMLFRRYVLRDLRPSAYVAISMRIILAMIGTWVVVNLLQIIVPGPNDPSAGDARLLLIAFVIGVFPPVVWQFIQSAFKRVVGAPFFLPSLRSQLPISDLDGLTVWNEARLEEEGIENIPNMATADLIELMIQTRLPADRIIDWADQAILYTSLGPEDRKQSVSSTRSRLRAHGIRTASSLEVAYQKSAPGADREALERIVITRTEDANRSPMRALVDTLSTNTNLELIRAWKGLRNSEPSQPT